MVASNFLLPILALCLTMRLQGTISADPLSHICSPTSTNYTTHPPLDHALSSLLRTLSAKTAITGFATASSPDRKYHGLGLCRGDVTRYDCKVCMEDATAEIRHLCPNKEEAIVWFDYCLVHYSNKSFFGKIDEKNKIYMWNTLNVSAPHLFNRYLGELMYQFSSQASLSLSFFATGEIQLSEVGDKTTIYGLAQCSYDLSSGDCKACLDEVIGELPTRCSGKQGGRVLTGSCNIRYEVYPFYRT
ncbi:hypothetical protein AMTRI_Chr02g216340 [Amborella trichopoda]